MLNNISYLAQIYKCTLCVCDLKTMARHVLGTCNLIINFDIVDIGFDRFVLWIDWAIEF